MLLQENRDIELKFLFGILKYLRLIYATSCKVCVSIFLSNMTKKTAVNNNNMIISRKKAYRYKHHVNEKNFFSFDTEIGNMGKSFEKARRIETSDFISF